ncbi:helix-turn-helix transcriptional regulator [Gordonia bronchialis]|uniref:helix-turn-helix domain-containing protein n=1 Tax=Gordonia bronchialis TaxID=2054 RepID=UPI001CBFF9D2|nr:helix-turn-helix transcriptional regulator [Gordonia bronchialis]UAK38339.1 helix-turn-helix transcriptional regulator [Gordonia bronchialis]
MATREIPEPWFTALQRANLTSALSGEPAIAPLAEKAGIRASTIHNIIDGRTNPHGVRPSTVRAIADALGVKPATVQKWIGGREWGAPKGWTPPPEAELLTLRERKAVEEIIRCFAANRVIAEEPKKTVRGRRPK